MDKQIVNNIMGFMMRVQLTGQEVPAFNAVMNALEAERNSAAEPTLTESAVLKRSVGPVNYSAHVSSRASNGIDD